MRKSAELITIFAPATAAGRSGVAMIRISGSQAKYALEQLTGAKAPAPRMAHLRALRTPSTQELIDHALVLYFTAPHSFTGEDVVELHIHGGRAVMQLLTDTLSQMDGLRLAEPGEFTRRAFLNGKMDLTAAEGIADLIDAETTAQRKQALRLVSGELEQQYESYRAQLLHSLAMVEAYIDFPDEDIPTDVFEKLCGEVKSLRDDLVKHLSDNRRGERIREGLYAAIIGAPNAGKSTLMNYLAKRDVSIVSATAGTTRDVVEVHLELAGYPLTIADTAGLRDSNDAIESEGVRRALERAKSADIKLAVFDASNLPKLDEATLQQIDESTLVILNKTDSATAPLPSLIAAKKPIPVSLKEGRGLTELLDLISSHISGLFFSENLPIITRTRHRRAIETCVTHLDAFLKNGPVELIGEELRLGVYAMASITGRVEVDEILGEIFSTFCIGK